jgi:hypothetical protein
MTTELFIPACPLCGSAKSVRVHGEHDYTCLACKMDFDGVDDGIIGRGRPETNAIRNERFERQRRVRR